jgi:hypothetical protein
MKDLGREDVYEGQNWKITGGNADRCENKGVAKKATQKLLKTKGQKYHRLRDALRVAEERRDKTGTRSAEP